ncbi:cytochrome P450 [Lindgomyces ingoldianus]|uniref:Cytochrome P450 n=1 Tax=Lindgomyces ingoldianus TaxID=673940 RepID=A0ACB6QTE1_9PLEO|nr:cytochrome P450 [Lindgomyces ingoldianus]KAF2470248.1 cytochrome P450 [Lindgomyces ingoldianus]
MLQLSARSITTLILTIFTYYLVKWTYNAFFHKLSKIPGPLSWRASRLPFIKSFLQGTIIHDIERLHERYGPILQIAPDELTFAHPDAWNDILQARPSHQQFPKDPQWWQHAGPPSLISTLDPQNHARMRKTLAPGFTERALREQEPILLQYVNLLIEGLRGKIIANKKEGAGGTVINDSEFHPWIAMLFNSVKGASFVSAAKCIPPRLKKMQNNHFKFIANKVGRRMNWEAERSDIIGHALKETKEGKGMSRDEIDSTFAIMATAGSETTATVLGGTINYLANNPDKCKLLAQEIRSSFKSKIKITMVKVRDLKYLNAVINEALRLCPPVPWILPRLVPSAGDIVCGTWLPGGTRVSIQAYSLHRNPSCFHAASSFIPERWLAENSENMDSPFFNDRRDAVQTFSVGPQACMGKGLAWAEMQLILAKFFWNFDMSAVEGEKLRWEDLRTFLLVEKRPIRVVLKVRAS